MKNTNPKHQAPHSTEELLYSIVSQNFSDGLLKGFTSVIEFVSGDILHVHSISSNGDTNHYTHRYFIKRVSRRRLLLGFSDQKRDLHVITVYDFDTMKVYAFIYAQRMVPTAKGTFTWRNREN